MQQPSPYATNRRVGCLMWLVILAIAMSGVGLLIDLSQELAWDGRIEQLNTLYTNIYTPSQANNVIEDEPANPQSGVSEPAPAAVTAVAIAAAASPEVPPTFTYAPTDTPAPSPTPLPTWTPVPTRVIPKDARNSLFVHGNGSPILPEGEQSIITVVAIGQIKTSEFASWSQIPVIVRNNTSTHVTRIGVTATARDTNGSIIASGGADILTPNIVQPGEIAFGYIYFGDVKLPGDTRFDFQADYSPAGDSIEQFESIRDLEVAEVSRVENRLVGLLRSQYDRSLEGPISIEALCFNSSGQLQTYYDGYSDQEILNPGATASFQITLDEGTDCTTFLVTGSAFTD